MNKLFLITICAFAITLTAQAEEKGTHLFILSGQSNMAGLKPEESFTPAVEKEFGKENVIVIKDAKGGQPIRRWYKKWELKEGNNPKQIGDLYAQLIKKVKAASDGKKIASVTFVWMQGERDAREKNGEEYAEAMQGIIDQVGEDLDRKDINFVIGRLSDFGNSGKKYPHWNKVREVQVKLAEDSPRGAWVDTDDLNDGKNRRGKEIKDDLHYSADGYIKLGQRFADKSIELIKKASEKKK